jgi:hypothetical protein
VGGSGNNQTITLTVTSLPRSRDYSIPVTVSYNDVQSTVLFNFRVDADRYAGGVLLEKRLFTLRAGDVIDIDYTIFDQFGENYPQDAPDAKVVWLPTEAGAIDNGTLTTAKKVGFFPLVAHIEGVPDARDSVLIHLRSIIDDLDTEAQGMNYTGTWNGSDTSCPYGQCAYLMTANKAEEGPATATWRPDFDAGGSFAVWFSYENERLARCDQFTVQVAHAGGTEKVLVTKDTPEDKRDPGTGRWPFYYLGIFDFNTGTDGAVTITAADNAECYRKQISADAVVFDLPKEQWPDFDTTQPPQPTMGNVARPKLVRPAPAITAIHIYSVRGRRIARLVPELWPTFRHRLPAGTYILREIDVTRSSRFRKVWVR